MKPVLKTLAVAVLLAGSQSALSQESAFPIAAEMSVGQPALDTYADRQARLGWVDTGGAPSFPMAAEENIGQAPLDTYADRHARNGTLLASSGSPFPVAAEASVGQPAFDTYADRYARENAAPTSAELDSGKLSISLGSRS